MANIGGMRSGGIADQRTRSRNHVVEECVPPSAWTEDSNAHCLLVDLPDFKKEEVKLQVDSHGQITVSGERLVNNSDKCIYFEQTFKLPEKSDIDKITGKFDGEILYVTVPKLDQEETSNDQPDQNHANTTTTSDHETHNNRSSEDHQAKRSMDGYRLALRKYWGQEDGEASPLKKALEMIKKNKGIFLTAVLAFSLGVLVTRHNLESGGE